MTATALTIAKPQYSLAPQSFEEALRFAELVAKSDLAPRDYKGKPGNVMLAVQMGAEVGLSPLQAIQNIAVIGGRPCLWGDAMLAVCMAHSAFVDIQETDDGQTATCTVTRKGRSPIARSFSVEEARVAGLVGKDTWKGYPKRMRQMRARAFALRDAFPDALRGLQSAEESEDLPQVKATVVENKPAPKAEPLTDAVNQKLQDSIDKPKDRTSVETDADWRWPLRGKNHDKKLSEMSDQDLVYYSENAKDQRLRDVAGAEVDRRINKQAKEFDESTKGSYLDGNGGEATEGEVVT